MEQQKTKTSFPTFQVNFVCWKDPRWRCDWASWVQNLSSVHQSTWKKAGIYKAIMNSTYEITRHNDLILELASRWCSDTNTFVFGWGEASITLEDMLVLGGFSAVGVSVLSPVENDNKLVKIEAQLERKRLELGRSSAQTAINSRWLNKFRGKGSDLEHAAFLSLWLSKFVFPKGKGPNDCYRINKHVFPVAARLSIGIKVALGPAVLALLYEDLTSLRRTQLMYQSGDSVGPVVLCAPFHLVQIWAWERFPVLNSVPNCAFSGENFPRLARWSNVKIWEDNDLKSVLDSANKEFLWCPYSSSSRHEGRDLESSAQCIKTSELRGFDSCVVSYQPQRVLKQFGLDQNILSDNVDKSIDVKLFLTPKPLQPTVKQEPQVKVEDATDCGPPGFPIRIEIIDVADSDSDFDDDDLDCGFDQDDILMETDVAVDDTYYVKQEPQVKVEDANDFGPPGFPIRMEVNDLADSDFDDDNDIDLEFGFDEDDILMETDVAVDDTYSVKVEDATDCGTPGFPIGVEVIDVADSDFDHDADLDLEFGFDEDDILMETDVAIYDTYSVEKTAESETAEKQQTSPLKSAQMEEFDQDFVP